MRGNWEDDVGRDFDRGCTLREKEPLKAFIARVGAQGVDANNERVEQFISLGGQGSASNFPRPSISRRIALCRKSILSGWTRSTAVMFREEHGEFRNRLRTDLEHRQLLLGLFDETGCDLSFLGHVDDPGFVR